MSKKPRLLLLSSLLLSTLLGSFLMLNPLAFATTYTITSMAQSGAGSLSAAITLANANPGLDLIECDASMGGTTEYTVSLPAITEDLIIDCSGSGSRVTLHNNSGGLLGAIEYVGGGNHEIKGLDIDGFSSGIQVSSTTTGSVTIGGTGVGEDILIENSINWNLGIDSNNVTVQNTTLLTPGAENIRVISGTGIVIGGTSVSQRNYINNAAGDGIHIQEDVTGITIAGNYIGLDADGSTGNGNVGVGVLVDAGASGVVIGGATSASRNLISDNLSGVNIQSNGVTLRNNYIGLNAAGTTAVANTSTAVVVSGSNNTIQENVISGNTGVGVRLSSSAGAMDGNSIIDNVIGLKADESAIVANNSHGIQLTGAVNAITDTLIQGNVIAGNTGVGINIVNTIHSGTQIWGNFIGTNSSLAANLGNGDMGLEIHGLNTDMDASADSTKRNIIVDNGGSAAVNLEEAVGTVMKNNYIGWDGTSANVNAGQVVLIKVDASDNVIGGIAANAENTFCAPGNPNEYVVIASSAGDHNTVRGNDMPCAVEALSDPIISVTDPANESLDVAPTFTSATTTAVAGTGACANCAVDIYGYNFDNGTYYITTLTADGSGNWSGSASLTGYSQAIAAFTNAAGSTSIASLRYGVEGASTTFTVENTNNSGAGSLRQAMLNAEAIPGNDLIVCDSGLSGTISLSSGLPSLNESVSIDCSDAASLVTVDSGGGGIAFDFAADDTFVLKGFTITDFNTAINVDDSVSNVTIGGSGTRENLIITGTGLAAITIAGDSVTVQATEISGNSDGITIASTSNNVTIGGATASAEAVNIHDVGATAMTISGASNVTVQNTTLKDALQQGLLVQSSASNITIGGTGAFQRNIIVSNGGEGIKVSSTTTTTIANNYIGLESDGTTANGNGAEGIEIGTSCISCTVGGSTTAYRNIISSSNQVGVLVLSAGTTVRNNYIGTNAAGTAARANGQQGVYVRNSTVTVRDNLISGNSSTGVQVNENGSAISGVIIRDNIIGLTADGSTALGNASGGILIGSSGSNAVTGTLIQGNVVSSNTGTGVDIANAVHTGTQIWGNTIGLNSAGTADRGNTSNGVRLVGASTDMDAGADATKRNVIAGNGTSCISIQSTGNVIKGNYCGLGANGTTEITNDSIAIGFDTGAANNVMGGILAGEENKICASSAMNVYFLLNSGAGNGNEIRGNDVVCDDFRIPIVGFGNLIAEMITRPLGGTSNSSYTAPSISVATPYAISGTSACDECDIDIYGGDGVHDAMYIGSGVAQNDDDADGNEEATWYFALDMSAYTNVLATYTDSSGNTSEATAPVSLSPLQDSDGDGIYNSTEIAAGKSDSDATDNDTVLEQTRTIFLASDATADGVPFEDDLINAEATDGGSTSLLSNVLPEYLDQYEEGFNDPTSLGLPAYENPGYPTREELQAVIDTLSPNFNLSESGGTTVVGEESGGDTFTIVLTQQPSSNVVFNISSGDTGAATVSPSTRTFTTLNWNTPQSISVAGVSDEDADDESVIITVSVNGASSDDNFDDLADKTVTATVTDDDAAGMVVAESGGTTILTESGTETFTVVLNAEPATDVVLNVSSGDIGAATVAPATLTFTNGNWDTPQTVTITGVSDDDFTDEEVTITIAVDDASSNNTFDDLADETLTASVLDDDLAEEEEEEESPGGGGGGGGGGSGSSGSTSSGSSEEPDTNPGFSLLHVKITAPQILETLYNDEVSKNILGDEWTPSAALVLGYSMGAFEPSEDSDLDGLIDLEEEEWGSDPLDKDSDNDSIADGLEVLTGTDPNSEAEFRADALDIAVDCGEEGNPFTDTSGHIAEKSICLLAMQGIIVGYQDGDFAPDKEVTRAEFVKMVLMVAGLEPSAEDDFAFTDSDKNSWEYPYITKARKEGIITGYEDGSFKPSQSVTRSEAVTILVRAFQQGEGVDLNNPYIDFSLDDWFAPYVITASYEGIVIGKAKQIFDPNGYLTRGEAAILIRRVEYAYSE